MAYKNRDDGTPVSAALLETGTHTCPNGNYWFGCYGSDSAEIGLITYQNGTTMDMTGKSITNGFPFFGNIESIVVIAGYIIVNIPD